MNACANFDHRAPDYLSVFAARLKRLNEIEHDDKFEAALVAHYRENPWDFVADWGMTFDPRNVERGQLASIPFVLWPKQIDYLKWIYTRWRTGERGLVEKSRDCGVTWLSAGFACSMWLFMPGFTCRFGSRKEDLVDKSGDMDAIFPKIWYFLEHVPAIFRPIGFSDKCRAYMRIINPANGAAITGEAGDDIGRGGRASIAFVDEAAFIDHQRSVDAALSQTTNCQIDISTPNGNGNEFYKKRMRFDKTDRVFVFDWRDDPRKDDAWYQRQKAEQSELTVAQEIDRDYNASSENAFIPAKWIVAAIDAHQVLGFEPTGIRATGFDPADVGDAKAVVHRYGSVITQAKQLTQGDITDAMSWAFREADEARSDVLVYDGDGMGAPVMKVKLETMATQRAKVLAYHGSGAVFDPKGIRSTRKIFNENEKKAVDQYVNYRAQTWSWVRDRFEATHKAVELAKQGKLVKGDPDDFISLASDCADLVQLQAELSRPRRLFNGNGKIQVEDKATMKRRQVSSPNLADALVIAMSARAAEEIEKSTRKTTPDRGHGKYDWMLA